MILSSLANAEQIASKLKYASDTSQSSVSVNINKDDKTTLTVNHKAQEANQEAIEVVKLFNQCFQETVENIRKVAEEFESTDEALGNQIDNMFPFVDRMQDYHTYRKAKNG